MTLAAPMISAKRNDDGASAVEYGLLLCLIAAFLVVAVMAVGRMSGSMLDTACVAANEQAAVPASAECN
jgi:Flp pilus assembly pilin Flp